MEQEKQEYEMKMMSLNDIKLGKNSRLQAANNLEDLMSSIKHIGILEPIGVKKNGSGYEILYGNRRFLAASKLGLSKVPVVVFSGKSNVDEQIMHLAENIQRRDISLAEAGRYFDFLEQNGYNMKEIKIKLGINQNYIRAAVEAFREVPKEFSGKIQQQGRGKTIEPGNISYTTAKTIISAKKSYGLLKPQVKKLFELAEAGAPFNDHVIKTYAENIKNGVEPTKNVDKSIGVVVRFSMSKTEYESLNEEHVENGPFRSINGLLKAILKGEKAIKLKTIRNL